MKKIPRIDSETTLIDAISRRFSSQNNKSVRLGIGDDGAVLRLKPGTEVVVTTDFTIENRHFRRDRHPPESVGHRCLARGLSDLAAMGATPVAAFISISLPASMLAKPAGRTWITKFFDGLHSLAKMHHVPLAGGDTSRSPGGQSALIFADIVLVGTVPKGKALRRSGAAVGDALYVTGQLGGAAAELASVLRSKRVVRVAATEDHPHLFPEPRLDVGEALLRRGLATACMDLSDGLSTDLNRLCRASGLGAKVEESALPVHPLARKSGVGKALAAALHGGEDYELLFTAPAGVRMSPSLAGVNITRIGTMTRARGEVPPAILLQADGKRVALKPGGWEHFSQAETKAKRASR
ncbi:MAG: thiamine-phosphate kinase [Acidobacteriota bacterium]|nr:thiamine-phosphate kinase [Acidobacteriota bacterium]